jgi:lysophospholipase L1-like esterase
VTRTSDASDETPRRPVGYSVTLAAVVLMLVVLMLIVAELFIRRFVYYGTEIRIGFGPNRLDAHVVEAAFEEDPELIWRLRRDTRFPERDFPLRGIVANSQGLRATHLVAPEKWANEIRILFVGDSVTFGWRVSHDETISKRAEMRLAASYPELKINCLNAGVPGYSLFQGWKYLETAGMRFEPDLVVVSFGGNDGMSWSDLSDFQHYEMLQAIRVPPALRFSQLAGLVYTAMNRKSIAPDDANRPRLTPPEFHDLLERLGELVTAQNAGLLLMTQAYAGEFDHGEAAAPRNAYQSEIARFGGSRFLGPRSEPAWIDATSVLRRLRAERPGESLFFDHVHPTRIGHEALAEAVAERLEPWIENRMQSRR